TDTVCGKCHTRSPDGIAASGGFVRHHEQWDEFSRSRHSSVMPNGCATCHDPHQPIFDSARLAGIQALASAGGDDTTLDTLPLPPGIIAQCTDCHNKTVNHAGPDNCRTCHMAFTTKSAVATGPNSGDIRSHAWLINTDATASAFTDADGNPVDRDDPNVAFSALNGQGRPFITLDFACLRCHTNKDTLWAAGKAGKIH
ncbi:MAG: cytochrome c3 family protein, partial [Phycisphaerae bacterium]